jgi:hypothetical protein
MLNHVRKKKRCQFVAIIQFHRDGEKNRKKNFYMRKQVRIVKKVRS